MKHSEILNALLHFIAHAHLELDSVKIYKKNNSKETVTERKAGILLENYHMNGLVRYLADVVKKYTGKCPLNALQDRL